LTKTFVDSGAWIGMLVVEDRHHREARELFQSFTAKDELLTTNYVLAETATWLVYHRYGRYTGRFRQMIDAAEAVRRLRLIWIAAKLHDSAWDVMEQFQDQDFSFADCSSIAACREENVDNVFGFDKHFAMAGFTLLSSP